MAKDQDFEKDFVRLKNVSKIYRMGEVEIRAVDKIEFAIDKGEFVVVVGPSGAGKTTVLNILGGMDTVTSGDVLVDGENIAKYSQRKLTGYRRDDIGFVFQFYNLVPNLTAKENVELALQICKEPLDAVQVLKEVGLGNRLDNFPAQLSGGEQQRVSIASYPQAFAGYLPAEKNDGDRHHAQFGTDADGGSCDQDQKRKSIENVSERKSRTDRKHRVVIE